MSVILQEAGARPWLRKSAQLTSIFEGEHNYPYIFLHFTNVERFGINTQTAIQHRASGSPHALYFSFLKTNWPSIEKDGVTGLAFNDRKYIYILALKPEYHDNFVYDTSPAGYTHMNLAMDIAKIKKLYPNTVLHHQLEKAAPPIQRLWACVSDLHKRGIADSNKTLRDIGYAGFANVSGGWISPHPMGQQGIVLSSTFIDVLFMWENPNSTSSNKQKHGFLKAVRAANTPRRIKFLFDIYLSNYRLIFGEGFGKKIYNTMLSKQQTPNDVVDAMKEHPISGFSASNIDTLRAITMQNEVYSRVLQKLILRESQ